MDIDYLDKLSGLAIKGKRHRKNEKKSEELQPAQKDNDVKLKGIIKDQEVLKDHVDELKKDQNDLMWKTVEMEVKSFEGKTIIRNLPLNKKLENMRENNKQSRDVVKRFLRHASLDLSDTIEIYRIFSKDEKFQKIPPMIVKFRSRFEFYTLMRKINEIKKIECYKDVQVHQFVPPMLVDDFKMASKFAFELRKKNQKTRIDVDKNRIVLRAKSPKDKAYKEIEYH